MVAAPEPSDVGLYHRCRTVRSLPCSLKAYAELGHLRAPTTRGRRVPSAYAVFMRLRSPSTPHFREPIPRALPQAIVVSCLSFRTARRRRLHSRVHGGRSAKPLHHGTSLRWTCRATSRWVLVVIPRSGILLVPDIAYPWRALCPNVVSRIASVNPWTFE